MLAAWGLRMYRWRRAVLAISASVLLASVLLLVRGANLVAPGLADSESDRALRMLESELHQPGGSTFTVLFSHRTLTNEDPRFRAAVERALAPIERDRRVLWVHTPYNQPTPLVGPLRSRDGHRVAAQIAFRDDFRTSSAYFPAVRGLVRSDELEVVRTGNLAFKHDLDRTLEQDLRRGEFLSAPLAFVVLLLVFGTLVASALPVGVGGLAVVGGMAGVVLLSRSMDITQYCLNVVSLIGTGVAIDYSLFIVNRYREELAAGREVPEALSRTLATAGRAVAFSGLAVIIGLAGLLFYKGTFLSAMGVAGALVVLLSVLYALTFLPALLAVLGPRVNALRVPFVRTDGSSGGFWKRLAHAVMKRPVAVLLPALALTVLAGLPFLRIRMAAADVTVLPRSTEARAGHELLRRQFPDLFATRIAVVARFERGPAMQPERIGPLYDYSRWLARVPGVSKVESLVDLDPSFTRESYETMWGLPSLLRPMGVDEVLTQTVGEHIVLLAVTTPHPVASDEARAIVRAIRANRRVADGTVYVTGQTALDIDTTDFVKKQTPWAAGFVMGMTVIVLFLVLGSVVLPLKAVLMNLLSISASFGAMVWIFQDGHLSGLLHFEPAPLEPAIPVVLFCAVFGLSMDYEVLMLTRMQEEYERTKDNAHAVAEGLERSGRLITSAAAIMIAVFFAFALARVVILKAVGIGMVVAVALDATLVRVLIVPSTMRLFGDLNWWAPAPLTKLYKALGWGHSESAE